MQEKIENATAEGAESPNILRLKGYWILSNIVYPAIIIVALVYRWRPKFYLQFLLERKVKRALRLSKLENRKYIVTTFYGRPMCISKQTLKEHIRRRKFKKGVTIADIEKSAYFITR